MSTIIGGQARGRALKVPASGTRPTSARVREALFSRLEHRGYIADCTVLDLFSGSGALALEAMSRGAARAVAVDAAQAATRIIATNARALGLDVEVVTAKAETYVATGAVGPFDVVFIDPPYDISEEILTRVLAGLPGKMAGDGMVVVERSKRAPQPTWPAELVLEDERTWGDTRVWSAIMTEKAIN